MTIQDKYLQSTAFELYKNKDISVEESYSLALDFLKVKKNKDGLNIIGNVKVAFRLDQAQYNHYFATFLQLVGERDFGIKPFRVFGSSERAKEQIVEYAKQEVNKVLLLENSIAENIEVLYYD